MAQGYFENGMQNSPTAFDYFFRRNPFGGGYTIFCGLENLIDILENYQFDTDVLRYLKEQGFKQTFVDYLAEFKFKANIYAPNEGEVVFANEPVIRVEGNLIECQLVETLLLNLINFQSLIATKASRIRKVAGQKTFVDFGLRRAQGWSGMHASRAAVIGGADSSSNVLAGYYHGIPLNGTLGHSWIQSFENELTAFEKFAETYPNNCILLVDTYNTLESGVPNAIKIAKQMQSKRHKLNGIRLDSGDLAYLSRKARKMLDTEGLTEVKIYASNQLDEYLIRSLNEQGAPIDGYGVGTNLITAYNEPALDGVFKMCMVNNKPSMKISNDLFKTTLPGLKKIHRYFDEEGNFYRDCILLKDEVNTDVIHSPIFAEQNTNVKGLVKEDLLYPAMENGRRARQKQSIEEIKNYVKNRLALLPQYHQRFENPHTYKVGISPSLMKMRNEIVKRRSTSS